MKLLSPMPSPRVMSMAMRRRRNERRCQSHTARIPDSLRAAGRSDCLASQPVGR